MSCGYMHYSRKEIEDIHYTHWVAQGSNPATNPIAAQYINPNIPIEVRNSFANPYWDQFSKPKNRDLSTWLALPNVQRPAQLLPGLGFRIPLVVHRLIKPEKEFKAMFSRFLGESSSTTASRIQLHKRLINNLHLGGTDLLMFESMQLYGIGTIISVFSNLTGYFVFCRSRCRTRINLTVKSDLTIISLITASDSLYETSVFLPKHNQDIKEWFRDSYRSATLIREMKTHSTLYPTSITKVKHFMEHLSLTSRFIRVPLYDFTILNEFLYVLKEFCFCKLYPDASYDIIMGLQYADLISFISFCLSALKAGEEVESKMILKYPVRVMHELLVRWYAIFPSECLTLIGPHSTQIQNIFYTFWFVLGSILDSVFAGARYLFTFWIDGRSMPYPFEKGEILKCFLDDDLRWYLNYGCRVIAFFNRRTNFMIRDPSFSSSRFRTSLLFKRYDTTVKQIDVDEIFIRSFRYTLINNKHFSVEFTGQESHIISDRVKQKSDTISDTGDLSESFDVQLPVHDFFDQRCYFDDGGRVWGPLTDEEFDYGNDKMSNTLNLSGDGTIMIFCGDEIDLLNGIDEESCLLVNDFDPKTLDYQYDEKIVYPALSVSFLDGFIEERTTFSTVRAEDLLKPLVF